MALKEPAIYSNPANAGNRIEKYLQKLGQVVSRSRDAVYNEALTYICSKPRVFLESYQYLQQTYSDATSAFYGHNLWSKLSTGDTVYKFASGEMAVKEPKYKVDDPTKKDFDDLFSHVLDQSGHIVMQMVFGYLDRPKVALRKKGAEAQKKVLANANKIGMALAESLYSIQDKTVLHEVLSSLYEELVEGEDPENTIFDCLYANTKYGPTVEIAAEGHIAFQAIDVLFTAELDEKRLALKYRDALSSPDDIRALGKLGLPITADVVSKIVASKEQSLIKKPNLFELYGYKKTEYNHPFTKTLHDIQQAVRKVMKDDEMILADVQKPLIIISNRPERNKLAGIALRKLMAYSSSVLASRGISSTVIPAPQGAAIFIIGKDSYVQSDEARVDANSLLDHYLEYWRRLKLIEPELSNAEMNTVLEYKKPPFKMEEVRKQLPGLVEQASIGFHFIAKRGIKNVLNLPEENYLRKRGFTGINFKQEQNGVQVEVKWGKWSFHFLIDRAYQTQGLEGLTDDNRDALLFLIFSYLKVIKNPDDASSVVDLHPILEETETVVENDEEKGKAGKRSGGPGPCLRVLPPGYKARSLNDSEALEDAFFHCGISLPILEALFLQLQEDKELFQRDRTFLTRHRFHNQVTDQMEETEEGYSNPIMEFLDQYSPEARKTIINLVYALLGRTVERSERPDWQKGSIVVDPNGGDDNEISQSHFEHNRERVDGQIGGQFVWIPQFPKQDYNVATYPYQVTFVKESDVAKRKARITNCPGVGDEIKKVCDQDTLLQELEKELKQ